MKYGEWITSQCDHAATKTDVAGEDDFLVTFRNCYLKQRDGVADLHCEDCGAVVESGLDMILCEIVEEKVAA